MDPSLEGGLWVLSEPAEQGPGVDAPPQHLLLRTLPLLVRGLKRMGLRISQNHRTDELGKDL